MTVWIVRIADPAFRDRNGVDKVVVHSEAEMLALVKTWQQVTVETAIADPVITSGVTLATRALAWADA